MIDCLDEFIKKNDNNDEPKNKKTKISNKLIPIAYDNLLPYIICININILYSILNYEPLYYYSSEYCILIIL